MSQVVRHNLSTRQCMVMEPGIMGMEPGIIDMKPGIMVVELGINVMEPGIMVMEPGTAGMSVVRQCMVHALAKACLCCGSW